MGANGPALCGGLFLYQYSIEFVIMPEKRLGRLRWRPEGLTYSVLLGGVSICRSGIYKHK